MRVQLRRRIKKALPDEWVKDQIVNSVMEKTDKQGVPQYKYLKYKKDDEIDLQF